MPDYSAIIRRSIEIVKKNKWLLVYGLILAGTAGGGGGSGSGGGGSDWSELKDLQKDIQQDLPQKTSQVLGSYTNSLKDWFLSINTSYWLLLGLGLLIVIVLSIVIGLVIKNWAKGSLITGCSIAENDELVDLKNTSPQGLKYLKNLIIYSLIVTGISLTLIIVIPSFWVLVYFFVRNLEVFKIIWIVLGVLVGFLTFIVAILVISVVGVYAERLIVLKNYKPMQAWKKGLSLGKKGFMTTLVMGIINSAIEFGVGCVSILILLIVLGIPGFIFISFIIKGEISAITIIGIVLLIFIFIYTNLIIRAALVVFKYANWNQIFNHILSQEESQKDL